MLTTPVSRPSRFRNQSDNVLGTAHTIAQLAKDVTEIVNVPFASQAASLVLSLLEIAKGVQDNNDASVRLATTAATYLIKLAPILDPQELLEDIPIELRLQLESFQSALVDITDYLKKMKEQNILKRIFRKNRISTMLQDREKALQDSYNALLMWTVTNTYIIVRSTMPQYDQTQVVLKGTLKASSGFFSELQPGELCANGGRQRVLVKRFASKTERDYEVKKWRKLWHANLPQLAGCSSGRSTMQFILFHDEYHAAHHTAEIRSIAAFLLEFTRLHDASSLVNKIIEFVNDAISAVRHMQTTLGYNEDETAGLAWITKCTALTEGSSGVSNGIFNKLFPYSTTEASMRYYFANLDSVPTHDTLAEVLDSEQLEKWVALEGIGAQILLLPNGYVKSQQYVMRETRWAPVDYSTDINPGDFGVLDPGENEEYAFWHIDNSAAKSSALFEYQSRHLLFDRDDVNFDVCEHPPAKTWRLGVDRLTDGCTITLRHEQSLSHAIHRSKRFLQLSVPESCYVDELVFVVGVVRLQYYQYELSSEPTGESQVADIYASLPSWSIDDLRFRNCAPGVCPVSCEHPLDSRISMLKYPQTMRIEYVKVQVKRHTASLEASVENFEGNHKIRAFKHKEYESIFQRRTMNEKWFWAEWP